MYIFDIINQIEGHENIKTAKEKVAKFFIERADAQEMAKIVQSMDFKPLLVKLFESTKFRALRQYACKELKIDITVMFYFVGDQYNSLDLTGKPTGDKPKLGELMQFLNQLVIDSFIKTSVIMHDFEVLKKMGQDLFESSEMKSLLAFLQKNSSLKDLIQEISEVYW